MEDRDDALFVRRHEPRDSEATWNLHNAALHTVGAHLGNGEWDDDLHDIEGVYLESGGEFLVGEIDRKIVAMGALKKIGSNRAEIKRMRVEPGFQRRGFGQRMLSFLERRAVELGYSSLRLDTTVRQIAARRLCERNGYRESGRGRVGRFECVFMEKGIGRRRG
ncbi:MAG: GNAT family N-acetyltransferase [Actinomycetota bacterium]|jgi:ribosomal protein S18 acetylase RimI-like enzyme|nr:GNAT family N-acetyltransferase [Rubrobacter sp.]MDQ3508173.1 GNAT family N-acetyltransferase [Actinomycetota bacterium]